MRSIYVGLGITAILIVLSVFVFANVNTIRNDGIAMEQGLSAVYEDNQNTLSAYISTFYEQLGLAKYKSAKMDTILAHAVQGRYGANGFSAQGAFFSAVKESYPDLTALNTFDRIAETVGAGRENFKSRQSLLLDKLRNYDTWRQQGLLRHYIVQFLGYPSENLKARVGGKTVSSGQLALEQMHNLVLTESTAEAFQTGRQAPLPVQ